MLPPERLIPQDFGALGRRIDKRIDIYQVGLLLDKSPAQPNTKFHRADIIAVTKEFAERHESSGYAVAISGIAQAYVNIELPLRSKGVLT